MQCANCKKDIITQSQYCEDCASFIKVAPSVSEPETVVEKVVKAVKKVVKKKK